MAWESGRYLQTVWQCLKQPRRTLGEQTISSTPRALAFALITLTLAAAIFVLFQGAPKPKLFLDAAGSIVRREPADPIWRSALFAWLMFLSAVPGHIILWSLVMRLVGGQRASYVMTLRLACYCLAPLPIWTLLRELGAPGQLFGLLGACVYLAL